MKFFENIRTFLYFLSQIAMNIVSVVMSINLKKEVAFCNVFPVFLKDTISIGEGPMIQTTETDIDYIRYIIETFKCVGKEMLLFMLANIVLMTVLSKILISKNAQISLTERQTVSHITGTISLVALLLSFFLSNYNICLAVYLIIPIWLGGYIYRNKLNVQGVENSTMSSTSSTSDCVFSQTSPNSHNQNVNGSSKALVSSQLNDRQKQKVQKNHII